MQVSVDSIQWWHVVLYLIVSIVFLSCAFANVDAARMRGEKIPFYLRWCLWFLCVFWPLLVLVWVLSALETVLSRKD